MVSNSASASVNGDGTLALEEMRQQRQQILNGESKAKSAEPPATILAQQQKKASTIIDPSNALGKCIQRGKEGERNPPFAVGNPGFGEQIARKPSVDCIEILDDEEDDIEELRQQNSNPQPQRQQQQEPVLVEMEDDDDEIRVIEEPMPPKRPRMDKEILQQQTGSRQPQQGECSPVPEDPKNSTIEQPKCSSNSNPIGTGPTSITQLMAQSNRSTVIQCVTGTSLEAPEKSTTAEEGAPNSANSSPTKPVQLANYDALLDRLEEYVHNAIDSNQNVDRKVLDALLAAINVQVQREPYSVRKLILEKQLVLPNTISFPPSQVVEMVIEHDPDHQLTRVINRLFGEERPKLSENERRERQMLKAQNPAGNMTRVLLEIGQDLVQESTYHDIVHARNLPEQPRNMDTYKQVAAQLKPVWEALKTKNLPHKLKTFTCQVCGFKTDSKTALSAHKQMLHFVGRRYQCTYCPEFDTNEYRITLHILTEHGIKPIHPAEMEQKELGGGDVGQVHCPVCEENFHYKIQRDQHLKNCRRDLHKLHSVQAGRSPTDVNAINRWLWDKPQVEPSVLNQQEAQQRQQQQIRQQQILLQQQKLQQAAQSKVAAAAIYAANTTRNANRTIGAIINQQQQGTSGMGGFAQKRGLQQSQRMIQQQPANSRQMPTLQQQVTSAKPSNVPMGIRPAVGPISAMSSMMTAAGGALGNAALSARMGLPPNTQNQQQQIAMAKNMTKMNLGAALAALGIGGPGAGGQAGKQPSVGEILRMAKTGGGNLNLTPQIIQAAMQAQALQQRLAAAAKSSTSSAAGTGNIRSASGAGTSGMVTTQQRMAAAGQSNARMQASSKAPPPILLQEGGPHICEICDISIPSRDGFRLHIQQNHKLLLGKKASDMGQGATLACSRCRERFWTYEGLERHLVMAHGLVTADLLSKAQQRIDAGKCKLCGKQYAFNMLQHLASDHQIKLCSAEIMYSCDVCSFKCSSYQKLETHLTEKHPKN